MALACMALALFTAGTSMADDNTGSGGTITYTDSNGANPRPTTPYDPGYVVHTFTNSGTLIIPVPASADVLVVGGGGSTFSGGPTLGLGGKGGGGASTATVGKDGQPNTGGGGGAALSQLNSASGSGGSGIVIVGYPYTAGPHGTLFILR